MQRRSVIMGLAAAAAFPAAARAHSYRLGDIAIGVVNTSGNTSTRSVNARGAIEYRRTRWGNRFSALAFSGTRDGLTTDERYSAANKTDFQFDTRNYAYTNLAYDNDRFALIGTSQLELLTLALAAANQGFVRWLKSKMQYVEMVSGAFVLLSGAYLLWYFYWVDVREESDPITDAVDRLQQRVQNWLNSNWQIAAIVLGGVIVAGIGYAMMRERTKTASSATPDAAPQDDLSHPVS